MASSAQACLCVGGPCTNQSTLHVPPTHTHATSTSTSSPGSSSIKACLLPARTPLLLSCNPHLAHGRCSPTWKSCYRVRFYSCILPYHLGLPSTKAPSLVGHPRPMPLDLWPPPPATPARFFFSVFFFCGVNGCLSSHSCGHPFHPLWLPANAMRLPHIASQLFVHLSAL